jgi:uncharacterized membrane protein
MKKKNIYWNIYPDTKSIACGFGIVSFRIFGRRDLITIQNYWYTVFTSYSIDHHIMFIKLYVITLPIFFAIDVVWLSFVAKNFYAQQIGYLMNAHPNLLAALLFYLLFIAGLVVFVITPALSQKSLVYALLYGALFGLVTYATYDLTNLATINHWPLLVTVVDLLWGSFLSASVCVVSYLLALRLGI